MQMIMEDMGLSLTTQGEGKKEQPFTDISKRRGS